MSAIATTIEVRELTNAEYHAEREHDSHSSLSLFLRSPAEYYHRRITRRIPEPEPTAAQQLGTAIHAALLEPDRLSDLLALIPNDVLSKGGAKIGKAWDEWHTEQGDRYCLKQTEWDAVMWMLENIAAHDRASELMLRATAKEQSVFWRDANGHRRKARFDAVCELDDIVVDLKASREPGPEWWRSVRDLGTHRQSAWYREAYRQLYGTLPTMAHIVVGNTPPHEVFVWTLPEAALRLGEREVDAGLSRLAECKAGLRPWRREQVSQELPIPKWFYEDQSC